MIFFGNRWRFFAAPRGTVYLLSAANIVTYAWCLDSSNTAIIPPDILFRNGALVPAAIAQHEYWRLVAYGFLHSNPLHLLSNLVCLVLWGGHLEKRVGSFYFIVIYASALVGAAIVSSLAHSGPFLVVGASGAISGVLGALAALWILGKSSLSAEFFGVNIGLNIALAFTTPNIDWRAHLGGFIVGMMHVACSTVSRKSSRLCFVASFRNSSRSMAWLRSPRSLPCFCQPACSNRACILRNGCHGLRTASEFLRS